MSDGGPSRLCLVGWSAWVLGCGVSVEFFEEGAGVVSGSAAAGASCHSVGREPMRAENVMGQREPPQHHLGAAQAAYGELSQVPLPQPGVDAFMNGAALVAGLA